MSPDVSQDAFIRNNSILVDPTYIGNGPAVAVESPATNVSNSYNAECGLSLGASGNNYSITTRVANPNYPATEANPWNYLTDAYDDLFVGGEVGVTDSAIGSTLAEVVANTNIKTGCALDTASPKIGAHQDYVDYINRTLSLPYSLPTPVA